MILTPISGLPLSGSDMQSDYMEFSEFGLSTTDWFHIVAVIETGRIRVYVNGIEVMDVATGKTYGAILDGTAGFQNFSGQYSYLCEVAVWDRVLKDEEIAWLYNGGNGNQLNI
jgi:hypothetical protein